MTPVGSDLDIPAAKNAVVRALQSLLREDAQLLEANANERSITHKLAEHLQREFPQWHVDCEYNRDGHEPKRLRLPVRSDVASDDTEARTVFPDVIVHHRDTDDNFLVLEAKKANNTEGDAEDKQKLAAFRNELGYKVAVFVLFVTGTTMGATATFLGDSPKKVRVLPGQKPIWE